MSIQSTTNDVPELLWSVEEEEGFAKAKQKANTYHQKINKIVSKIVATPFYQAQFSDIATKVKEYIALDKEDSCNMLWTADDEKKKAEKKAQKNLWIKEIKDKLLVEMKREKCPLSKKVATDILNVIFEAHNRPIQQYTDTDLNILQELAKELPSFLKKNANLFFAITSEKRTDEIDGEIEKLCKFLNNTLESCSRDYIGRQVEKLSRYNYFLSYAHKVVAITSSCLRPPIDSHSPLVTIEAALQGPAEAEVIKEENPECSPSKFVQRCDKIHLLKKCALFAMKSKDFSWKLQVAKEILNTEGKINKTVTFPLLLDAFYILSKDSSGSPQFYKMHAIKLCNEVNKFGIESNEKTAHEATKKHKRKRSITYPITKFS